MITLTPGAVTLATLRGLYWQQTPARLDPAAMPGIENACARVAEVAAGDAAVYGINTGFGKLASIRIAPGDVEHGRVTVEGTQPPRGPARPGAPRGPQPNPNLQGAGVQGEG